MFVPAVGLIGLPVNMPHVALMCSFWSHACRTCVCVSVCVCLSLCYHLQTLYERSCDYLELDRRVEVLNARFTVLQGMLDMMRDHITNTHRCVGCARKKAGVNTCIWHTDRHSHDDNSSPPRADTFFIPPADLAMHLWCVVNTLCTPTHAF